jgi:hypothetical protein
VDSSLLPLLVAEIPRDGPAVSVFWARLYNAFYHGETALQDNHLQATQIFLDRSGKHGLGVEQTHGTALGQRQPLLFHDVAVHGVQRVKGPGVEAEGQQGRLVIQLSADGREQRHAAGRARTVRGLLVLFPGARVAVPPGVLVSVEDAALEAALGGFVVALAVPDPSLVFPPLEAHVDLADVEDEFVDAVAQFGRESEEGGEALIALPAVE